LKKIVLIANDAKVHDLKIGKYELGKKKRCSIFGTTNMFSTIGDYEVMIP